MPIILGAGISGLAAGFYLLKQNIKPITIVEATNNIGGWIKSQQHDNYIFESGPRTIRPRGYKGRNTLELIDELGLSSSVHKLSYDHIAARNRMIYVNKKLHSLPSSPLAFFRATPPFSQPLFKAIIHDLKTGPSKRKLTDESIYSFVERRFGHELAEYAISAMICGICAGDAKQISVKFLLEDVFRREQRYGGVIKGMLLDRQPTAEQMAKKLQSIDGPLVTRAKNEHWSVYSINGGLQKLPQTLAEHLEKNNNVTINVNAKCNEIQFESNGNISLTINGMENKQTTDYLISSLPSYVIGKLLTKQHPTLANELTAIPYVNVAVVNLQFSNENLIERPGFGFLIPPCENLPILGVIFDSCCFSMPGNTVLTVMMGGQWFDKWFGESTTDTEFYDIAMKYVQMIMGIQERPNSYKVNVLEKCIPQYVVGHHERIQRIRNYIKENRLPLGLCGAAYDGVGVNDVIYSAKKIVQNEFTK